MTTRNTILNELNGLGSTLANYSPQNFYEVPDGYFEGLPNQVLARIKALEASNPHEELEMLSPLLNLISKEYPYSVPSGYFDALPENMLTGIKGNADYQDPSEELASISPMLGKISKVPPYSLPEGYFENLGNELKGKTREKLTAKLIPITGRKWFRYAAAAVVISFIAMGGWMVMVSKKVDPVKNPDGWVAKNTKKISTEEIYNFINLADEELIKEGAAPDSNSANEEIRELMKDVPESEIQNFLNETAALEDNDADILLN